jgi:hypothetical protein
MKSTVAKQLSKQLQGKLKDYLNSEELNDLMLIGALLDTTANVVKSTLNDKTLDKIRIAWNTRGNLSKEEHKSLKMAETYLTKFYTSILNRLSINEVVKINKRNSSFNIRILDKFTLDKLNRQTNDKYKNAVVPREQFENWCEEIMEIKCKGCTKDRQACKLHEVFEDNFVQESDWGLDNCRYAYNQIEILNKKMPRVLGKKPRGEM